MTKSIDILSQFFLDLENVVNTTDSTYNILDFIKYEAKLGINLTAQQETVLATYYNLPLEEKHLQILDAWRALGKTSWDEKDLDREEPYQILALECGRRGGKSSLSSIIGAYEFYRLCKMPCPQEFYGISKSTEISILVLATTATQSKTTIFGAIRGVIRNSPYFKHLEEAGKLFVGKEAIKYEDKLLAIYAGNSQSSSQVGGTVKVLIMDECARFKDKPDGESNAIELWSNLGIAGAVFGKHAKRVAISSAWFQGDAIEELFNETREEPNALGFQLKSWDLNPIHAARDNPVVVAEYRRDPIMAALEFEGVRPATSNSFLNQAEIKRAMRGTAKVQAEVITIPPSSEVDKAMVGLEITHIEPYAGTSVAHLDPAIIKDAYAAAFGHSEFDESNNQIIVIDGILGWEPDKREQKEVSILNVQKCLLEIHRLRPIRKLTADQFNSAETLQRLRLKGLRAIQQFFTQRNQRLAYSLVRQLLHENRLVLPADSPWSGILERELSRVQLIRGSKIDHPKGENEGKDFADCVAFIAWELADSSLKDRYMGMPAVDTPVIATAPVGDNQKVKSDLTKLLSGRDWFTHNLKGRRHQR